MKMKQFTGLLVIVLACILMSAAPLSTNGMKSAKNYVKKLSNDVQLTDSQAVAIEQYAAEYFTENVNANAAKDKKVRFSQKKVAYTLLKTRMDSVLTPQQKELLNTKTESRKAEALSKIKTN